MKTREEAKQPGFTLIELIVAVVIIGILASIAVPRYVRVVEKGRTSEARNILGTIRDAETAYILEHNVYTNSLSALGVTVPAACNTSFYFRYSVAAGAATFTASAVRCTAGGRSPNSGFGYTMTLTNDGVLNCNVSSLL